MIYAALLTISFLAPPAVTPYLTSEQQVKAAYSRKEFHQKTKATSRSRMHDRLHRYAYYGQLVDVAFTSWAVCSQTGREANPVLTIAGDDCASVVASMIVTKGILLAFMEWQEAREKRKHGCSDPGCPDLLYKHLNVAPTIIGSVGFAATAISMKNVSEDPKEEMP